MRSPPAGGVLDEGQAVMAAVMMVPFARAVMAAKVWPVLNMAPPYSVTSTLHLY